MLNLRMREDALFYSLCSYYLSEGGRGENREAVRLRSSPPLLLRVWHTWNHLDTCWKCWFSGVPELLCWNLCSNKIKQNTRWFVCTLKSEKQCLCNENLSQRKGKGQEEDSWYGQDRERWGWETQKNKGKLAVHCVELGDWEGGWESSILITFFCGF